MLSLKTPDPNGFRSARHFAAWIGLTPKDHSTGGKIRLGAITRAGDETLRSVLVVGATALIRQARRGRGRRWPWLQRLLERKPPKLVAVALANKIARIAWKLMVSGQRYDTAHIICGASASDGTPLHSRRHFGHRHHRGFGWGYGGYYASACFYNHWGLICTY